MKGPADLGLRSDDHRPLVVSPGRPVTTRGDVATAANTLASRLLREHRRRLMVRSDDPVDILRGIEASRLAGVDIWIAHTTLPRPILDATMAEAGIDLVIDDGQEYELDAPVSSAADAGHGHVHVMTSGTTGHPKVAAHAFDSLLGRIIRQAGQTPNQDGRWLLTYQATGFAGLQVMLTAVLSGGTIVVPAERTPSGFVEAATTFGVTQISATPTFWRSFLMAMRPGALDLRQITLGGEGIDQSTLDRVRRAFPDARITHIYASTEAGVVFAVHDGLAGFPAAWLDRGPQGVELAIRDGFLHIRTPYAMRGYVSQTTQPLLADGWLATADRCEVVGDRVRIVGRDDSTINVAGSKVYPLAVETFLLSLPEVAEARVYGVPNPISGFLVGADVVLTADADPAAARARIQTACREQLAGYQIPRVLKIVESVAVGASGKKG